MADVPSTQQRVPTQHASAAALGRDLVVIGASAGGLQALSQLIGALPADYRGSVFVVMHTSAGVRSELPSLIGRHTGLPTLHAEDGRDIEPGHVYVAPPDRHLLIEPGRHLGGLSSGGLGYTDIGNKYAVTGLGLDFYRRLGRYYGQFEAWLFEPRAAWGALQRANSRAKVLSFFSTTSTPTSSTRRRKRSAALHSRAT